MIEKRVRRVFAVAGLVAMAGVLHGQTGGTFDLSWSTIDSGEIIVEGGDYKLAGVIGQPEASGDALSGGPFSLAPGFLQDATFFPVPVTISGFSVE